MTLKDSLETARQAPLLYVSPNEIRFQIPAGTEPGAVAIAVQMGLDTDWTLATEVDMSAPGLFPANGNGRSVVAAAAVRSIAASVGQDPVPVLAEAGSCFSVPIDLGVKAPVYVSLYCTGIRGTPKAAVAVLIAGQPVPILKTGAQPEYDGLD